MCDAAAEQQSEKKHKILVSMGICCCCMLLLLGMSSGDVCYGIDTRQHAATTAPGSRRLKRQQQPIEASRSRKQQLGSSVLYLQGFPAKRLCISVLFLRSSNFAAAAQESGRLSPPRSFVSPHEGHDR